MLRLRLLTPASPPMLLIAHCLRVDVEKASDSSAATGYILKVSGECGYPRAPSEHSLSLRRSYGSRAPLAIGSTEALAAGPTPMRARAHAHARGRVRAGECVCV